MVRDSRWGARGSPSWKITSKPTVPSLFRRHCGLTWARIEFQPSLSPDSIFYLRKKKAAARKCAALPQIGSVNQKLHFSHGDFVYVDGVTFRHFPGDIHFHAEILIRVHAILIFDFHDLLGFGVNEDQRSILLLKALQRTLFPGGGSGVLDTAGTVADVSGPRHGLLIRRFRYACNGEQHCQQTDKTNCLSHVFSLPLKYSPTDAGNCTPRKVRLGS